MYDKKEKQMKIQDLMDKLSKFDPNKDVVLKERDSCTSHKKCTNIRVYQWKNDIIVDGW